MGWRWGPTFVIVWQQDLDPKPAANRDRVLAYSNGGLLPWLGLVRACRGDLRTERLTKGENTRTASIKALVARVEGSMNSPAQPEEGSPSCIRLIHLFKEPMERSATPNIGEEKQKCPRREQ